LNVRVPLALFKMYYIGYLDLHFLCVYDPDQLRQD